MIAAFYCPLSFIRLNMMKGKGFVHPNVLEEIAFTKGALISNEERTETIRREHTVELPFAHSLVRKMAVDLDVSYFQQKEDIRAESVLSALGFGVSKLVTSSSGKGQTQKANLSVEDVLKQVHHASESTLRTQLEKYSPKFKLPQVSQTQSKDSVKVVMDHSVSGQSTFAWVDHDGVMSGGIVPQVQKVQLNGENDDIFIKEKNMKEDERVAFQMLLKDLKGTKAVPERSAGSKRERTEEDPMDILSFIEDTGETFDEAELARILKDTEDRLGI